MMIKDMPVNTGHYFPPHINAIEEYKRITAAYDKELRLLWAVLGAQYDNQYFDTMDEEACARWESIIGIPTTGQETLAERRVTIKGRWAGSLPYTTPKFHEVLRAMLGSHYTLTVSVQDKTLHVGVMLAEMLKTDSVYELMRSMAPADMDVIVETLYNRWSRFQSVTWGGFWNNGADTWSDPKQNIKWQEGGMLGAVHRTLRA